MKEDSIYGVQFQKINGRWVQFSEYCFENRGEARKCKAEFTASHGAKVRIVKLEPSVVVR